MWTSCLSASGVVVGEKGLDPGGEIKETVHIDSFDGFRFGEDSFRGEFARLMERLGVPERGRRWDAVYLERWERFCVGRGELREGGWPGRVKEDLEGRGVADWPVAALFCRGKHLQKA